MKNNNIDQETEKYFNELDEDNDFTNPENSFEFYNGDDYDFTQPQTNNGYPKPDYEPPEKNEIPNEEETQQGIVFTRPASGSLGDLTGAGQYFFDTVGYHSVEVDFFDEDYYLEQNPGLAKLGKDPLLHYREFGAAKGKDPHPLFDTDYYLEQNPDVAKSGKDPLLDYFKSGATEGKDPHPLFDTDYYLEQNPDLATSDINPLVHYIAFGASQGKDPNPFFDTDDYLEQNPDVAKSGINPLVHYIESGGAE
jgi:hypothetical protein